MAADVRVPAETPPITLQAGSLTGQTLFIVVGAGGNGARVVPPLTQMTRRGDKVLIFDHDIVEDRNLRRQHFTSRDIGQAKAIVLADRYRRDEIEVSAMQTQVTDANAPQLVGELWGRQRPTNVILIGCVDNAAARRGIQALSRHIMGSIANVAWVDVGNETRGGQVLLTARWQLKWLGQTTSPVQLAINGLPKGMPQLLKDAAQDTAGCAERIDIQTVQVNAMAASAALNCVSWLLMGLPFSSCGVFFSTLNTMQPIKFERVAGGEVLPETTYAL